MDTVMRDSSSVARSHDELMARGGQYAELFSIQTAAYR